eukprot:8476149-Alexandrium_andersonii.AAC.1
MLEACLTLGCSPLAAARAIAIGFSACNGAACPERALPGWSLRGARCQQLRARAGNRSGGRAVRPSPGRQSRA